MSVGEREARISGIIGDGLTEEKTRLVLSRCVGEVIDLLRDEHHTSKLAEVLFARRRIESVFNSSGSLDRIEDLVHDLSISRECTFVRTKWWGF